jgi:hypothetical protein
MRHAGGVGGGQLERVELVIVPGAQIDGIALAAALGQPVDIDEEVEALLEFVGQSSRCPRWATSKQGSSERIMLLLRLPRPLQPTPARPIEPRRIVDKQRLHQFSARGYKRQKVDQRAVVGHVLLDVGMRPVGAPQHAVGETLDQGPGEGDGIVEGRSGARDALRPADLHPEALVLHQVEQHAERFLLHALAGVHAPHVVDHHGQREFGKKRLQHGQPVGVEMHHRVPAERHDLADDRADGVEIGILAEMRDEVEAHAAHAALVETLQFLATRPP